MEKELIPRAVHIQPGSVARAWPKERAAPADLSCRHRGEQLGTVDCEKCKRRVTLKVFACALHERCAIETAAGVKVCATCADRSARAKLPAT
jgi:hypothetical protein